jgi:hypothetical protein
VEPPLPEIEPLPPADVLPGPAVGSSPPADAPAEAVFREALKLMDDLAGVKAAMALLAEIGQAPGAAGPSPQPDSAPASQDPAPAAPAPDAPPSTGGAPSGAAGAAASSSSGSAALYALLIALAAFAGGLWGRLHLVTVRWRSVAIVALNERPG